jgi:fermentation-respiration switch protein FrsA (DUF1100 family)
VIILVLTTCTTIEIKEQDIFDIRRTISTEYFSQSGLELEQVTFEAEKDMPLNGWFIRHPSAQGTVLFYGGNGFLKETAHWIIKSITDQQMNLFTFNYRGYGKNPGEPTISGIKADGLAAYQYLVDQRNISPSKIIIHGHSLGTLIGLYVAEKRPSAGVVLESPLTDAEHFTEEIMPNILKPFIQFKVDSTLLKDSNIDRISKIQVPLLILVGKEDPITPPAMARKLYRVAVSSDKRLMVLKDGTHNDLPERDDYQRIINDFYKKTIQPMTAI